MFVDCCVSNQIVGTCDCQNCQHHPNMALSPGYFKDSRKRSPTFWQSLSWISATGHASLPELRIWHPLWIEPLPPRTNAPAASSALFCGQTAAPACMLSWTSAPSASKQLQNLGQHSKILKYLKVYAVKSCTIPRLPHVSDDFHLIHVRRPED